jgi:lipopolysaccharide transport protein LptA
MGKMERGMKQSGGRALLVTLAAGCAALAIGVSAGVAGAQQPARPPAQPPAQTSASSDQQSVQIKSDKLEGLKDQGRYIYTGSVEVVDGKSRLIADKLTVICDQPATPAPKAPKAKGEGGGPEASCTIKTLVAETNVYYFLDDDKVHGDRAEYDYANRVITVTGTPQQQVVLSRADKGVISGPKLVYDVNKGVARMSGLNTGDRVTSIFVPKDNNASTPPAPGQATSPAPSPPAPH